MKGIGNFAVIVGILLAAFFVSQKSLQSVWQPGDLDLTKLCSAEGLKTFVVSPDKVLVFLSSGTVASEADQIATFEGTEWTSSGIRRGIYDYMLRNSGNQPDFNTSPGSALSGSVLARDDGLYWLGGTNSVKFFTADQKFRTITVWKHPELFNIGTFNTGTGYDYNRKYIGDLYGLNGDAEKLTCAGQTVTIPVTGITPITTTTQPPIYVSPVSTTQPPVYVSPTTTTLPIVPTNNDIIGQLITWINSVIASVMNLLRF